MSELSLLKYSRLRDYLDQGCKRFYIKRDPSEFFLSMEQAVSVQVLVSTYNEIYIWLASFMLKEIPGFSLNSWFKTYQLHSYEEHYLFDDLSKCFNENVLRLFKGIQEPTKDDVIYYLANLRELAGVHPVQEEILSISGVQEKEVSDIISARNSQYRLRKKIEKSGLAYKFRDVDLFRYKTDSKVLASRKRIFDVAENKFGEENDMSYEKIMAEIEEDEERNKSIRLFEEQEKQKEEENRKLYEKRRKEAKENRILIFKITAIMTPFVVILIALYCYLYNNYPTQVAQGEKILKIVFVILFIGIIIFSFKEDIIKYIKEKLTRNTSENHPT